MWQDRTLEITMLYARRAGFVIDGRLRRCMTTFIFLTSLLVAINHGVERVTGAAAIGLAIRLGRLAEPRQRPDGELHPKRWINQPQGNLEVIFSEGDATSRRLGSAGR
jgi:hypothetical protein